MSETTQLELITPAKIMVQKEAEMVVAPGAEGLFGVLPRHAPLLADLARGIIEVHENGKIVNRYMIDGGLADVTPEAVTILAQNAEDLDTADAAEINTRANAAPDAEADFLRAVAAAI